MAERPHRRIDIQVSPQYLPEQSDPDSARYVFAYTITITNRGDAPAQLISRHWIITDVDGEVQEVRGLGVVGHQPFLKPGEQFQYTSGCALKTPAGSMAGSYQMVTEAGEGFEVPIPAFTLSALRVLH